MTIELHTWRTPNGYKASIMLEELGLPYSVHPIDISKNEQFDPKFLAISPNNRIPAILDPDGPGGKPLSVFETGAILFYLAEKTGSPLFPAHGEARYKIMQWLMWQMGGVGPMFGQAHHFRRFAKEQIPYAIDRYTDETKRLYGVMDKQLGRSEYLAGDAYSIADIATYPWVARHEWQGVDLNALANVKRWYEQLGRRPAVQKGMTIPMPSS